jgi:hypothetical protein
MHPAGTEKNRVPAMALDLLKARPQHPGALLEIVPITYDIASTVQFVPRDPFLIYRIVSWPLLRCAWACG